MPSEKPVGWVEEVPDELLRPATIFGAAPRGLVIAVWVGAGVVEFLTIMLRAADWATFMVPIITASASHVGCAALTRYQPHWFEMVVEWFKSPQHRVDP